eukprot:7224444-Ditylum_brightwellii.AAC.1
MIHLVPTGASGVRLKSKCPFRYAHADTFGFTLDARSKFIVMFACLVNLHHNDMGHVGSIWQGPA